MRTLKQAKAQLMRDRFEGVVCPCCEQYAKVYKRTITASMALWLIWLVQSYRREKRWYHVRECLPFFARSKKAAGTAYTGDYAKLLHWGLLRQCTEEVEGKKSSGLWKPTRKGYRFALGRITVPRHAYLYDGHCIELSGPAITITDALGTKFDYEKLMRGDL